MEKSIEILCVKNDNKGFSYNVFNLISTVLNKTFQVVQEGKIVDEELVNLSNYREFDFFKNDEYRFMINDKADANICYFIDVKKRTINDNCNVFFTVYYTNEDGNKNSQVLLEEHLYSFKIELKNLLINLFDKCYWVYDQQVEQMCGEVYALVNRAENMFRTFIVNFMITQYGINWWDNVAKGIKGKQKREDEYHELLVDFKGIDLEMYNLDIKDLAKLVDNQYSISLNFQLSSNKELPSDEIARLKLIKNEFKQFSDAALKDVNLQVEIEKSFWEHDISAFFIDKIKFKDKWDSVCENRNHIAHNKVIDRPMYKKICEDSMYIIEELNVALAEIQISMPSQEKTSLNNRKKRIEEEEYIYNNLSEYGHRVESKMGIISYLDSYLYETYISQIQEMVSECDEIEGFSFSDISINEYPTNELGYVEDFKLISIKNSTGDEYSLTITAISIQEELGATSSIYLKLYVNGEEQNYSIEYGNADGGWNSEEGYFTVEKGDSFEDSASDSDGNLIIEELKRFLQ
ncbi:hypothetical protein MOE39_02460 [Bacillus cereus]|uniref:hypothetical protein n=1 Tax=Bacillus cereus TaxID=1396 RepID=UPI0022817CDE|nr:hypothetical protein [Bacillus cereus]